MQRLASPGGSFSRRPASRLLSRGVGVLMAAGMLAVLPVPTASVAAAQELTPPLSLEAVHNCLCLEQEMSRRTADMEVRGGILKERESELQRLGMEIEVKRAAMSPGDEVAMAELKMLIDRQQALRDLMRRDIMPSYQDSVRGYNDTIAEYNASCAGRRIYQPDIDKLQGNLQCPARP